MRPILSIFLATFLFGCSASNHQNVSTTLTSFVDPAYKEAGFKKAIVIVESNNIQKRTFAERLISNILVKEGYLFVPSVDLFPPTRQYDFNQFQDSLRTYNFDSFLIVTPGESGFEKFYIPNNYAINKIGNTVVANQVSGGEFTKPWMELETKLFDRDKMNVAWIGSSFSGGNSYADNYDLLSSFTKELMKRMADSKVIQKSKHLLDLQNHLPFTIKDPEYFYKRGNDLRDKDSLSLAVRYYSRAIELDSTKAVYYYARGLTYYQLNNNGAACNDLKKSAEMKLPMGVSAFKELCK